MKKQDIFRLLLVTAIVLVSSCNKNDDGDNTKYCMLQSYDAVETFGSENYTLKADFTYDSDNKLLSSEMIVNESDGSKKSKAQQIITFTPKYEGNVVSELSMDSDDGYNERYVYTYKDNKIVAIDEYWEYSERANIEKSNQILKKIANDQEVAKGGDNHELINISYDGDRPITLKRYEDDGINVYKTFTISWEGNNISSIEIRRRNDPDVEKFNYKYDSKKNMLKGLVLSEYITPYASELGFYLNFYGLITYFSDNNVIEVERQPTYSKGDDTFKASFNLEYTDDMISKITGSIMNETEYSFSSTVKMECK